MAGYDDTVIFEGVQRMALEEFLERQCKDFAREIVKVSGVKIPPAMIDKARKLMMDTVKHFAGILKDMIDEFHEEQTSKAAAVMASIQTDKATVEALGKIQTGKMDKAPVDEIQTEKMDKAPVDEIQTEKMDKARVDGENGWWDVSVGANGKYRLPADFVRSILAMPRVPPHAEIPYLQTPNLAKILGVTEESLEEDRRLFYGEDAERSKRINDNFVQFQDKIREEWDRQGYVEVGEEYITNMIKTQELSTKLCEEQDWADFPYADPNDPYYASLYEHCREGDPEGFCLLKYE